VAIRALYVEEKLLPLYLLEGLQKAKTLRESADYYDQWSKTGVETISTSRYGGIPAPYHQREN
jgi:hypothetical protein